MACSFICTCPGGCAISAIGRIINFIAIQYVFIRLVLDHMRLGTALPTGLHVSPVKTLNSLHIV